MRGRGHISTFNKCRTSIVQCGDVIPMLINVCFYNVVGGETSASAVRTGYFLDDPSTNPGGILWQQEAGTVSASLEQFPMETANTGSLVTLKLSQEKPLTRNLFNNENESNNFRTLCLSSLVTCYNYI